MRHVFAVMAAVGLLAACGGGGGGGGNNSQTTTVNCLFADVCDEITAVMSSTQQTSLSTACTGAGGTFAVAACSTTGAVAGHCHYTGAAVSDYTGVTIAGATMNEYYYTSGGWTSGDAQAYCESPPAGTWVP